MYFLVFNLVSPVSGFPQQWFVSIFFQLLMDHAYMFYILSCGNSGNKILSSSNNCYFYLMKTVCPRSGRRPRGATPCPRSWLLCGHRRAERSYSTFKVRRCDLVQGKEQWLRFAGAAVKRYPMPKVRETQVRR